MNTSESGKEISQHVITSGSGTFSSTAGGYVEISHNTGLSGYQVIITPNGPTNGYLGEYWVSDETANTFRVYKTGSASGITFNWAILKP